MTTSFLSQILKEIGSLDEGAMAEARARQNILTKPRGSLGRLEELSVKIAGITGKVMPRIEQKVIVTMAGDHGVVAEGVSAYPQKVTAQMVYNFLRGGAGINGGIEVINEEVAKGLDIVGVGDMGIGNTTPSSAICAVMTGKPVDKVTGKGAGIGDEQLASKVKVIETALALNKPDPKDAIDVLSKVGGFEIGGIAGVILGAAAQHIPVVIDGFIAGAAALIATKLCSKVKGYFIAAHVSAEIGHRAILDYLGLKPLLDLEMRLGEGTGAAIGEAAVKTLAEMATFADAGVSEKLD